VTDICALSQSTMRVDKSRCILSLLISIDLLLPTTSFCLRGITYKPCQIRLWLSIDDLDGYERTIKLLDGDDPINYDFFRHKGTGEVINYDPRLEPEKLKKRGVKLEWFPLA